MATKPVIKWHCAMMHSGSVMVIASYNPGYGIGIIGTDVTIPGWLVSRPAMLVRGIAVVSKNMDKLIKSREARHGIK